MLGLVQALYKVESDAKAAGLERALRTVAVGRHRCGVVTRGRRVLPGDKRFSILAVKIQPGSRVVFLKCGESGPIEASDRVDLPVHRR